MRLAFVIGNAFRVNLTFNVREPPALHCAGGFVFNLFGFFMFAQCDCNRRRKSAPQKNRSKHKHADSCSAHA